MSLMTSYSDYLDESNLPLNRISEFCRYLRENGFQTTTRDAELFVDVLQLAGSDSHSRRIEQLWRPIACSSLKEWKIWSELFQLFWFPQRIKGTVKVTGTTRRSRQLKEVVEQAQSTAESGSGTTAVSGDSPAVSDNDQSNNTNQKSAGGASVVDPLGRDVHSQWLPSDLTLLERTARSVRAQLLNVQTRRWRMSNRGRELNLRKTTQSIIRLGGDSVIPQWQTHRRQPPQIVMVIDVSRSMESYAAFYLRLARAFSRCLPVKVFVFHVRYAEITDLLLRDNPQIQEKIDAVTAGFQGGTKIASSLKKICFEDHAVNINRRTRIWIFSDGFDTDEPTNLRDVLARIRGRGGNIDWFYPNKTVAGMSQCIQLAKVFVKNWYSAGNLKELDGSLRQMR
jgi:uncharacterized protein with von Willebrand factor type A (vWA) domain